MKRNEMTLSDRSGEDSDCELSRREPPNAQSADQSLKYADITELRLRLHHELLPLPDNDIIDFILAVVPEQVGQTYESMMRKRYQEDTNNGLRPLNRSCRPKQDKLKDLLSKMTLKQLQDLDARLLNKLLEYERPQSSYI